VTSSLVSATVAKCLCRTFICHILACPPALAQSETGFLSRTFSDRGGTVRYQVYVPADYTPARRWPVILFLHGAGERGTDSVLPTKVGMGPAVRQHPAWFPAIVVFPQAQRGQSWRAHALEAAFAAYQQSVREFGGDANRAYLVGLSMGGYGVWELALNHPSEFAAIVSACGGVAAAPRGYPEITVPSAGTTGYATIARRLVGTPVWLFHGSADTVVPVTESRQLHAAFQAAGGKTHYTEYPGVGHGGCERAFAESTLWSWLFAQSRASQR
jgi:predicted peptidase